MQHTQLAVAILAALSANALANTQPQLPAAEFTLDEIVVTATRTARTVDESLAAVTVITRKEIEKATSLQSLLAGSVGITLVNKGGAGKDTDLFLRGAQANHTVVLIDGVKIGSATKGTAAWQDIPLEAIERIEIVRGPNSSLYGSEAIGGVVQLFTRKGHGALQPAVSVGMGAHGTRQLSASLSGGSQTGWFNLAAGHNETDGFSAQNGAETDNDGYRNRNVSLRGGARLSADTDAEFTLLRAAGDSEYDGTASNESESVQLALGGQIKHRINDLWQTRLQMGQSKDESEIFLNSVLKSRFNTRRDSASWLNDLALSRDHTLTLGLDWQQEKVNSSIDYTVTERDNTGLFTQWQGRFGVHDVRLALRRDDNSQFGGHTTGNAAWGLDMGGGLRGRLSYGTAFKAPTFNDLYWPGSNPNLRPEKSESFEIGVAGKAGSAAWTANAFSNRIDNLIAWACVSNCGGDSSDDVWLPSNVDKARIRGLEATVSTRVSDWVVGGALTVQSPENRSIANYGKKLPRRAEQSLRLDLDRSFGAWTLGTTLRGEGKRYDNLANTTKLGGYGLVDLRAEWRLAPDWRFQGRIENLFDKVYETAAGYNQPDRGIFLTLRWQPAK